MTYADWISWFEVQYDLDVTDLCHEATMEMWQAFPELRRVRGVAIGFHKERGLGEHPHWWCVAPDGTVLDPTASQFDEIMTYQAIQHW